MTSEVPTKVRLVRCPKCRNLLPELPNIPVYQCGGCHTILQAKRRKSNNKDAELLNHETDGSQKIAPERASKDEEARISNQEELSSPGALISNENNGSDKSDETERNRKQTGEIEVSRELPQDLAKEEGMQYGEARFSDGAASSIELDHQHESAESSPVSEGHNAMAENAASPEQDGQPNPNRKQPGGSNISNEVVSSTEVDHEESRIGESLDSPKQYKPRDEDINEYRSWKQPEDVNFSDQVDSSAEFHRHRSERSSVDTTSLNEADENQDFVEESKRDHESDSGEISSLADKVDEKLKQPGDVDFPDEVIASSTELNHFQSQGSSEDSKTYSEKDVEESYPITGAHTEYDEKLKEPISSEGNKFLSESFSTDGLMSPHYEHTMQDQNRPRESWSDENVLSGSSRSSIPHRFSVESFLTDGLMSPRNELLPEDQSRDFDGNDMSENFTLHNSSSEFTGRPKDAPKSRTTSFNYVYEGSASSSDETDNPISLRRNYLSGRKLKEAEAGSTETTPKRDEDVDKMGSGFPATGPNGRNSSSVSPANNRYAARSMKTDEGVDKIRSGFQAHGRNSSPASPENNRYTARSMKRDDGVHKIRSGFPATLAHGRHSSSVSPENNRYTTRSMKKEEDVNKIRRGFPAMQPHGGNSSSISPENNRYAARISQWHQDELEALATNALPARRARFQNGEGTSKLPPYSKSHRAGGENGNHPNFVRRHMGSASSKRPEDLEKEKIELLKMVYNLQTELKRTHISNGRTRFPGDHVAPEAGIRRDLNHTRSAFSCNQGRRPYQARDSRIPFSAEATIRRRQDETYCLHCCPQDWQLQELLPPHSCCCKAQSAAFHSGRRSHLLHHSGTSSPLHYATSEASDDHWHRDHETRRVHREKAHSARRLVRPVVGGAPLVACYKCFEVLQLPADFLLFKRKVHQLQCSGCAAILKFSLHKGTHIVPYKVYTADADVEAVAPPPSEVDAFSDPNVRTKFDSDDYGPPNCYSTESEPFVAGGPSEARPNGRTVSSGSSYEPADEKRKEESLLKSLGKKIYSHAGTFSSATSSSSKTKRVSSEIQEASGSPLHKLMGYASPSKVMLR